MTSIHTFSFPARTPLSALSASWLAAANALYASVMSLRALPSAAMSFCSSASLVKSAICYSVSASPGFSACSCFVFVSCFAFIPFFLSCFLFSAVASA